MNDDKEYTKQKNNALMAFAVQWHVQEGILTEGPNGTSRSGTKERQLRRTKKRYDGPENAK